MVTVGCAQVILQGVLRATGACGQRNASAKDLGGRSLHLCAVHQGPHVTSQLQALSPTFFRGIPSGEVSRGDLKRDRSAWAGCRSPWRPTSRILDMQRTFGAVRESPACDVGARLSPCPSAAS